jgi:hypothetical protein
VSRPAPPAMIPAPRRGRRPPAFAPRLRPETDREEAPNAIRIPTSRVRRLTARDVTPYMPTAASAAASTPNTTISIVRLAFPRRTSGLIRSDIVSIVVTGRSDQPRRAPRGWVVRDCPARPRAHEESDAPRPLRVRDVDRRSTSAERLRNRMSPTTPTTVRHWPWNFTRLPIGDVSGQSRRAIDSLTSMTSGAPASS